MTTNSTTPPLSESRPIYVERVNAVIDYIEAHLSEDLSLAKLAEVAHFSPYHFHRVFSTMVGETLSRFISRLRVERAATLLVQHPDRAITDVAVDCGFTNPSSFARSFRESFGMSASEWRTSGFAGYEREPGETIRDVVGNLGLVNEEYDIIDAQISPTGGNPSWSVRAGTLGSVTVTVEEIPALNVAYVRHTGSLPGTRGRLRRSLHPTHDVGRAPGPRRTRQPDPLRLPRQPEHHRGRPAARQRMYHGAARHGDVR